MQIHCNYYEIPLLIDLIACLSERVVDRNHDLEKVKFNIVSVFQYFFKLVYF